ncbi:hypothetical protein VOLCADRAFT_100162 [Volvox carteri f. nagariensis]|uniref:Uncharacterized protein n=1 Tax=Volvox carteri f. nagariensis TaxID=3068 RepID=D8UJK2_VOLCA|nr:uncharacterized protein VOLCADRAFT_100162 [Volvox carteri f. nagariensis]EFJ40083.1 hypothetical protein VOLCADRAFT_100162 [Volvox carteri f. nagariensis]|eukprot:XP_002958832.1 hypothetical protein VOLCADRAFT_100162 [Volvox carteri f. nagariensis]
MASLNDDGKGRATCWADLLPELRKRILSSLPPNEVACNVRLTNKEAAEQFRGYVKVLLADATPHHAFAHRWGAPGAMKRLTLEKRSQLCCLTARSGCLDNLQLAVSAVGCPLKEDVFYAAAAAGHLDICRWLVLQGCHFYWITAIEHAASRGHLPIVQWILQQIDCDSEQNSQCSQKHLQRLVTTAWVAAASAGHLTLCQGLLADGFTPCKEAVFAAAGSGHVSLTAWLLLQLSPLLHPFIAADEEILLSRAAYGFTLPALKVLATSRPGGQERILNSPRLRLQALISPTPDWRVKLEWLEAATAAAAGDSVPDLYQHVNWSELVRQPDSITRVEMLRKRLSVDTESDALLAAAVCAAKLPLLRYLAEAGIHFISAEARQEAEKAAAALGDVTLLSVLPTLSCRITYRTAYVAAACGHLHVLEWLEGPGACLGGKAALETLREVSEMVSVAAAAAGSGSVAVSEWLWQRGHPMTAKAFATAVAAGCEELVVAMAARGYPMTWCCLRAPDKRDLALRAFFWLCGMQSAGFDPYLVAGENQDFLMLSCLRRLGCPWDSKSETFTRAVLDLRSPCKSRPCSLAVLKWLLAEGCPVDWRAAKEAAARREDEEADIVRGWVRAQARARRGGVMRKVVTLLKGTKQEGS